MLGRHQRFVADEEGRGLDVERQAEGPRLFQAARHVGRLEEAVMDVHREEALAELLDFDALVGRHERRVLDGHMHQQHALVQHLVVLEIVQQRAGNRIAARGQEHGGAGHAHRRLLGAFQEQVDRHRFVADALQMRAPSDAPGLHQEEHAGRDEDRQPAAFDDLDRVGGEEHDVDEAEQRRTPRPPATTPHFHCLAATSETLKVSITITPVTAMP